MARSPKYRPSRNSERGCLAYRVEPLFLFRIHEYKGKISRDRLGSARFKISAGIRIVAGSVVPRAPLRFAVIMSVRDFWLRTLWRPTRMSFELQVH